MKKEIYTSIKTLSFSLVILLVLTLGGSCSSVEKQIDKRIGAASTDSIYYSFGAVLDTVGDSSCSGATGCFNRYKLNLSVSAVSESEPIELPKVADSVSFDIRVSMDGQAGMCYETRLYDVKIVPCPESECGISAETYPSLNHEASGGEIDVDHPTSVKFGQGASVSDTDLEGGLIVILEETFTDSCGTVAVDITNFIARKGGETVPSEGK